MSRYALGDDAALADVYDALSPPLFAFLMKLTRERAHAEDLVHDTFLRIVRARTSYRDGADVIPWAFAIGRRLFLDAERSRKRSPMQPDKRDEDDRPSDPGVAHPIAAQDDQLIAKRLAERIDHVLAQLPETQQTAFRLLKQEGMSVAEASAVLGATEMSVKLRAHRAYEALRDQLGDELGAYARPVGNRRGAS